jgi:hypothetical protein
VGDDVLVSGGLVAAALWGPIVVLAGIGLVALRNRYGTFAGAFAAHPYATNFAVFFAIFGVLTIVQAFFGTGWSIALAAVVGAVGLLMWAVVRRRTR